MSVFETLSKIDVNKHTEKKNGLTYLSWAWSWQTLKEHYPQAQYTIYENELGFNYHTDGITAWVKVGVTVEEQEHIEYLPVMDYRNQSIPKDEVTSFDVNKAIQRALTKAIARHGLGLYIYTREDIQEPPKPKNATKEQVEAIKSLLKETKADTAKFLQVFKVKTVEDMTDKVADQSIKMLNVKKKKMQEA